MANQAYTKKITIEIVSKGRKYFKVRYPGKAEFQLLINEISQDFQPGQVIEDLLCEFEYKHNSYTGGGKTTAIPVNDKTLAQRQAEDKAAERQAEIKKWRGYVEKHLLEGYVYRRGLNELKSLGFDISVFNKQIAEIEQAQKQAEIQRWSGYCESAALEGREYQNGLKRLTALGCSDMAREYRKQAADVRAKANQDQETVAAAGQPKKDGESHQEGIRYRFCSPAWIASEDRSHLQVGDLYKDQDGQWYKILTQNRQQIYEDGMSFGLADEQGEIVTGTARLATPEEAAPMIAAEEAEAAEVARRRVYAQERKDLAEYIRANGERPEHRVGEQRLLDTANLYGGGDWFEIDEAAGEIWYCKNNGSDGDDWSYNNVSTWGAGAIGWCVPYDDEIANRIKALVDQ